jgi:hypothetical protein
MHIYTTHPRVYIYEIIRNKTNLFIELYRFKVEKSHLKLTENCEIAENGSAY